MCRSLSCFSPGGSDLSVDALQEAMVLRSFVKLYDKAMGILNVVVGAICALILASVFAVVVLEVISRYFFRMSFGWVMDFAQFGLIFVVFLGGSILFHQDDHISVTILPDKLSPKALTVLKTIFNFITLYFLSLLFRSGYSFAIIGSTTYSTSRLTLMIYPRMAVPVGTVLMALQVLNNTFKGLEKLLTYSPDQWIDESYAKKSVEDKIIEKTEVELKENVAKSDKESEHSG